MERILSVDNVHVKIENKTIVEGVSFHVDENDFLMIIGPNGAGKSTLIKAVMQICAYSGDIMLYSRDVRHIHSKELAKKVGVLSQKHSPQFSHSVYEVVSLGRYAYQKGLLGRLSNEDEDRIDEAMCLTGVKDLKNQSVLTLSGGELQRVFLAQLFAQDPALLILDEPANHLDIKYQILIFDMIKKWSLSRGRAVIAVVHDLNTVYTYGTRAMLMNDGKVYQFGETDKVLSRENLRQVYQVDVAQWMQSLLSHWNH